MVVDPSKKLNHNKITKNDNIANDKTKKRRGEFHRAGEEEEFVTGSGESKKNLYLKSKGKQKKVTTNNIANAELNASDKQNSKSPANRQSKISSGVQKYVHKSIVHNYGELLNASGENSNDDVSVKRAKPAVVTKTTPVVVVKTPVLVSKKAESSSDSDSSSEEEVPVKKATPAGLAKTTPVVVA
uniref:Uncharacterized protein n=1 Tax=Mesocestoides corti TaxID=53468 RepID=A0A5K3G5Z4_MESCO